MRSLIFFELLILGFVDFPRNFVDVRDVALAHILAAELIEEEEESKLEESSNDNDQQAKRSKGRWIVSGESLVYPHQIASILSHVRSDLLENNNGESGNEIGMAEIDPTNCSPRNETESTQTKNLDSSKIISTFGSHFRNGDGLRDIEDSVRDMCLRMVDMMKDSK